jgi:hypothetical protein
MDMTFIIEAQKADLGAVELGRQKLVSGKYLDFKMRWRHLYVVHLEG